MAISEVKGAWFITARRYILQDHGPEVLARYVEAAPVASREAMRRSRSSPGGTRSRPCTTPWRRSSRRSRGATPPRFTSGMERCAVLGTHWFLQILVSASTPRYLIRLLPAALRQVRRGSVRVVVDVRDATATLRFINQPFSDHPCYRMATPAILRAILRLCVGQSARATLTQFDSTNQVVELAW